MPTLLIAVLVLYLTLAELLDWPARMEKLRSTYPRIWKRLNYRAGRVILLVFAIGLLAADIIERQKPSIERHTHVEFFPPEMLPVEPAIPFIPNKVPKINVGYKNGTGIAPVRNGSLQAKLYYHRPLREGEDSGNDMYSDFLATTKFQSVESMLFEQDKVVFHTYYGSGLTIGEAESLAGGTLALCAVGGAKWEDDTGKYRTELCACMNPQRHVGANPPWGNCSNHNGEVKLWW